MLKYRVNYCCYCCCYLLQISVLITIILTVQCANDTLTTTTTMKTIIRKPTRSISQTSIIIGNNDMKLQQQQQQQQSRMDASHDDDVAEAANGQNIKDFHSNTLQTLAIVTNQCLDQCLNDEFVFVNDFDVTCSKSKERPQCFRARCFKGCNYWWQAVEENETCQEVCASLEFYPYDLPCISACELSQCHFWQNQQLHIQNVLNAIKPQLILNEEFMLTIILQWPILQLQSEREQKQKQKQYKYKYQQQQQQQEEEDNEFEYDREHNHNFLVNRPFIIQYQSLPINDDKRDNDNNHDDDDDDDDYEIGMMNESLWWNLLDYNCNEYFECDITDSLMPYTKYRFRFVLSFGNNMEDDLLYSPPTSVYITPAWGKPLSAPIITSILVIDYKQVIVYWQAGKYRNGPLINYKVKLINVNSNKTKEMLFSRDANYYIFNDLLPSTNYSIKICMINNDGLSPWTTKFFHTLQKPTESSITYDDLEYVLLSDQSQIILKSMDFLNENRIIYKTSEQQKKFYDFDYHYQFKLIFLIDNYGDILCIPLDNPTEYRKIILDERLLNIKFKVKKLSLDWLNQQLYIAGEIIEQLWQIFCLDFNGTIIDTITEGYNISIALQQISVDPINGWLFALDMKGNLLRLNLATKNMKIIYNSMAIETTNENSIISYFYNDYKHYLLLIQNATTKEFHELSYDGRYNYKVKQPLEQQQNGLLLAFRYLNSQPIVTTIDAVTTTTILLSTNGTHILWHDYETNEQYNWIIEEMPWCWRIIPILQLTYYQRLYQGQQQSQQHYPFEIFKGPKNLKALLTSQMANITWQSYDLVDKFQTSAAWQQWDYELEILDVASNSAFNIRNIKTLFFVVERLQPNNQYRIKVRAAPSLPALSTASTVLSSIIQIPNRIPINNHFLSDWSEPLEVRTWPLGDYKFIWATENGFYETNVMGKEIIQKSENDGVQKQIRNFIQVNSTLFYVNAITKQLECLNYLNPEINCSFRASNVYSMEYEYRSGKLYWSDTQRNCIIRKDLNNDFNELLPIFEGRFIRLDSIRGLIYYQTQQRLVRRPLNGVVLESLELEYYRTQNLAEDIIGFVIVLLKDQEQQEKQQQRRRRRYHEQFSTNQFIYWLISQQDDFPILYRANVDSPETFQKLCILDHYVLPNSLEYLIEIDKFIWLKKDGYKAVIASPHNIQQYTEFETPFGLKAFSVKLKNNFEPSEDLKVQPDMPLDFNSIYISDGCWDDFNIKWSAIQQSNNLTIFYRVLIQSQYNNNNNETMQFMTFEVLQPSVRVRNFQLSNDLINVTITPHTFWSSGVQQTKQLRIPAAIPKQPRNLRVFVKSNMRPLENAINITTIVRWESPEDVSNDSSSSFANPDVYYKVYCWLNNQLVQIQDYIELASKKNHLNYFIYEVKFYNLKPLETYNFEVKAYIQSRSLSVSSIYKDKEKTYSSNQIMYHLNPEIQAIPKLIYTTAIGIGELDLDLNRTKMLVHTIEEVEHLSIIWSEQRLIWVNENVELMSYTMDSIDTTTFMPTTMTTTTVVSAIRATISGTALKLARMRAEVLALTVDWIQRIVYWAELSSYTSNKTVIDIYQLNLCHYDGKIMHGTKLLTINTEKSLKTLLVLPYSQLLIWLEYDSQTDNNNTLQAWSIIQQQKIVLKIPMALKYVFEGCFSFQKETINLIDNKGKLCSYDINRELCTWIKIPLYKQYDYITRDSGYIYTLYNNTIKAYDRRSHILKYIKKWPKNDIKLIKAYNYQEYPKRECLWPHEFTFINQILQEMIVKKGETFIILRLPTKITLVNQTEEDCLLDVPGIKYSLIISEILQEQQQQQQKENITYRIFYSFNGFINITNLKPFTNYSCNLNVTSYYREKVQGVQSEMEIPTFHIITNESNPTKPRNFIGYALSPTEIWLTWQEPTQKNAKTLYYELHWEIFGDSTVKAYRQIDGYNVILNKLEPSQDYILWLEVYAVENKRNSTKSIKIRTYDPPGQIVLIEKQAYNITLLWSDKNWLDYYDQVYVIWHSLDNHDNAVLEKYTEQLFNNNSDNYQNVTIFNLQPKMKYEFRLKLFYKNVQRAYIWPEKPYEGWIYETLGDVPSKPGQPQFQHITGEIFKIYWEIARNHGSPIVEYSLEALQVHPSNYRNKRKRRSDEQNISSSILMMAQMPWAEEIMPIEDQWLIYCNTTELSCIVNDLYSKRLRMFRVRARNEQFGWGPYSNESKQIFEPFVSHEKRYSLVLAILSPIVIVSTCIIILIILRKVQKHRIKTKKKLLEESRPSYWTDFSNIPQEISLRNRAFSLTSYNISPPLTDGDIALLPHIQWNRITLLKFLGSGAFGEVYEGLFHRTDNVEPEKVAIKCLRKGANEFAELLQEAQLMSNFHHENIVRLIGVCCETESISIIMEHMDGGDLLSYLRDARNNSEQSKIVLNVLDLLDMCLDVATGMSYLEDMHYVHRDLACRNCLITCLETNKRLVKIGDFGLARDIYKSDYYRKEGEALLPVRWMAPESLIDGIFTTQTDVWSFGVLCWEIFTLGQQPYAGRNNFDVLNYVKDGGRLEQPKNCPDNVFQLLLQCWKNDSDERPTFRFCLNHLLNIKKITEQFAVNNFNEDCPKFLYANHKTLKDNFMKEDLRSSAQALAEVYEKPKTNNNNCFFIKKAQHFKIPTLKLEDKMEKTAINENHITTSVESDLTELYYCKIDRQNCGKDRPDYYINEGISHL